MVRGCGDGAVKIEKERDGLIVISFLQRFHVVVSCVKKELDYNCCSKYGEVYIAASVMNHEDLLDGAGRYTSSMSLSDVC